VAASASTTRCSSTPTRTATIGVLKLFLQKGMVLAGLGIVAGMIISASTASLMGSLLYGVRPHDPAVFVIVPLLLFAIAVLASYLPARRATKVNPIVALREG
jgi:putative ABC transport system permease protein